MRGGERTGEKSGSPVAASLETTAIAVVATEPRLLLQFLATESCVKRLDETKALLSHRCPGGSLGDVIEIVLTEFVERHSPVLRQRRREARTAEGSRGESGVSTDRHSRRRECDPSGTRTRHIPAKVRDEVFAKDEGRCTYVARDGTRCESRHALQVDHIHPYAAGGTNDATNLRLLCAAHNRHAAERALGAHVMKSFWPRQ